MQLPLPPTFQPCPSPKEAIPYSSAALRQDLQRVRNAWDDCQVSRDRNAIYAYLSAVYGLVAWWTAEGREVDRARRALRLQRLEVSVREDSFAAIIRCTADPTKADKRTRSKWSRVMRYAAAGKRDSEPLNQFIKRKGASTNARLGSLGALNEVRRVEPQDREWTRLATGEATWAPGRRHRPPWQVLPKSGYDAALR
jgi:hypothetical protein